MGLRSNISELDSTFWQQDDAEDLYVYSKVELDLFLMQVPSLTFLGGIKRPVLKVLFHGMYFSFSCFSHKHRKMPGI